MRCKILNEMLIIYVLFCKIKTYRCERLGVLFRWVFLIEEGIFYVYGRDVWMLFEDFIGRVDLFIFK